MRQWRHRPFCIALLLYQALWLNAVVPGHTRGAVLLPGSDACAQCIPSSADGSQSAGADRACCSRRDRRAPTLPGGRASNCAICSFAAVLSVPPAIESTPSPLVLLRRLPLPRPAAAPDPQPLADYDTRGPPAARVTHG